MAGGYPGHSAAYRAAVAQRGPAIDAVKESLAAAAPATHAALTLTIPGEPLAYARARLGSRGIHYTPAAQRSNMAYLRMAAIDAMAGRPPFDCPLRLDLSAEMTIPQSWSGKRQALALAGERRPAKRPDLSNLLKLLEDAWNTVVWRDDCLIVECHCRKVYSKTPKLVVTVAEAASPAPTRAAGLFAAAELPLGFAR